MLPIGRTRHHEKRSLDRERPGGRRTAGRGQPLTDTRVCPECEMEFDWPGVEVEGKIHCCEACSLEEPCLCPQHDHAVLDTDVPTPTVQGEPGPL